MPSKSPIYTDAVYNMAGRLLLSAKGTLSTTFGNHWWVDTVNGDDGLDGTTPDTPFRTMGKAFSKIASHDMIHFVGKVREQLVAPLGVYGVTIVGEDTRPRHDLAASWTVPATAAATTPLLRLREQGWVLANFLMYGTTDSAAVMLKRREDATDPDASHAQFLGMRFVSNFIGIEDNGGHFNVLIDGRCIFQDNTDAIKNTSTTIANPLSWSIEPGCLFRGNTNCITSPASRWKIEGCTLIETTTTVIDFTGGVAPNVVVYNHFDIDGADFDPAGGVTGVSGDVWHNLLKDGIETGLPAN